MKPLMIVPIVAIAAMIATPTFAASKKHVRHHSHHRMMQSYAWDAPQRPVFFNGRMIGRANDENIRIQMRNDESLKYR